MKLYEFIEEIYRFGLERFRRYYGPYKAVVVSNKDPQSKGRIQVSCPRARLGVDNKKWLYPMEQGAGLNKGAFWPPDIGDGVWIFFDNGDPTRPLCYIGGWYGGEQKTELSQSFAPDSNNSPNRRGFLTPGKKDAQTGVPTGVGGHKIILDDTSGEELVIIEHVNGQRILIDKNGVMIGNKNGQFERIIKGDTFKKYMESHIHPTPVGPSGVPTEPVPDEALSKDTKTS